MNIETTVTPQATVLRVSGRIDAVTAAEFDRACLAALAAGAPNLVLDFAAVRYISSAGLRCLLNAAKALGNRGGSLHLAALGGIAREVVELAGFGSLFPQHENVETALEVLFRT